MPAVKMGGPFGFLGSNVWGGSAATSLIEAESKFGSVVRGAGGAIFGIEKAPLVGSRQEEKLQIGTPMDC